MESAVGKFSPLLESSAVRTSAVALDATKVGTPAFEEPMLALVKDLAGVGGAAAKVHYFSGGITNTLACVEIETPEEGCENERCLVRVYGHASSFLIDRNQELIVLAEHPHAPRLAGRFANGFVCAYTPGRTMSVAEARVPRVAALTAAALAQIHAHDVPSLPKQPALFATVRHWLANVSAAACGGGGEGSSQQVARLRAETAWLEAAVAGLRDPAPVCFCHNDLLFGNILLDEAAGVVRFIDWEYGCRSWAPFDIANHFNEHAGFMCTWELYPTPQEQRHFIRSYLAALLSASDDAAVERWIAWLPLFDLASHLFWGVWALLQNELSEIDFDYASYAARRIARYDHQKAALLAKKKKASADSA